MLSQALDETRWHPLIDKCLRVEQLDSRATGKSRTSHIEKLFIDGELSKCVELSLSKFYVWEYLL